MKLCSVYFGVYTETNQSSCGYKWKFQSYFIHHLLSVKHDWKQNQPKNKQTQIDHNNSKRKQSIQLSKIKRKNYNTIIIVSTVLINNTWKKKAKRWLIVTKKQVELRENGSIVFKQKGKRTTEKENVLLSLFHTAMIEGQKDSEAG